MSFDHIMEIAYTQTINIIKNRLATKLVVLKVYNVKLSFDIWLLLYIYFILYS